MKSITNYLDRAAHQVTDWTSRRAKRTRLQKLIEQGTVVIGRHTYGTPRVDTYKGSDAKVIIGSYCSISRGVVLVTGGIHPTNWIALYPFRIKWNMPGAYGDGTPSTRGGIVIGSDVWIGTDAMIMSGVNIGDGAVVAARSVVTRDVEPYTIVAGAPARPVRKRFSEDAIEQLTAIQWWNWPESKIKEAVNLLSSPNIDAFIAKYRV